MTTKNLFQIIKRSPFRPFQLRLSNGNAYAFKEPSDLGVSRDKTTLFYFGPEVETFAIIDAASITEVEEIAK